MWEPNPDSLQDQPMLLSTEPSYQFKQTCLNFNLDTVFAVCGLSSSFKTFPCLSSEELLM